MKSQSQLMSAHCHICLTDEDSSPTLCSCSKDPAAKSQTPVWITDPSFSNPAGLTLFLTCEDAHRETEREREKSISRGKQQFAVKQSPAFFLGWLACDFHGTASKPHGESNQQPPKKDHLPRQYISFSVLSLFFFLPFSPDFL